ncbi:probable calcium-binding protein CML22 isoform X5 [Carya illinoinensis]|uniref:probable calcium-binding protein CML22 isoform X5 n=1 Tax=Carya illinoinensis TaxID=32201 RepID=UPI001C71E79D|nr:probable calcium-binding protein CML22 isoform X5 [Carya illinoinensis]
MGKPVFLLSLITFTFFSFASRVLLFFDKFLISWRPFSSCLRAGFYLFHVMKVSSGYGGKIWVSSYMLSLNRFPHCVLFKGTPSPWLSLKSLSIKVRSMLYRCSSPNKYKRLDAKLERKMVEAKKGFSGYHKFKSINSIIMKFPQLRDSLKNIRAVFEQYDEDSNGTIDQEELKKCLQKLQLHLTEEETSRLGSPRLEATFDTVIEVFLFLDKNGNGKLNKNDMVKALNDASPREKSPSHITRTRFEEMDWDRNGQVSFREFLFAFIKWVGIDTDEEMPLTEG